MKVKILRCQHNCVSGMLIVRASLRHIRNYHKVSVILLKLAALDCISMLCGQYDVIRKRIIFLNVRMRI